MLPVINLYSLRQHKRTGGPRLNRESLARFSGVESITDVARQTSGKICIINSDLGDWLKTAVEEGSSQL